MEFHPIAELFPMMSDEERKNLGADILLNGLHEAIWTHDGKIIDGRNRALACAEVGVAPRYREWDGVGSLAAFVVSLNLKRRHLTASQRAMVAARMANIDSSGRPAEIVQKRGIISQTDAAEILKVSIRSVSSAKKVLKHGIPGLAGKVESGEIKSVEQAAEIAEMPPKQQKRIIRKGRAAARKLLTKLKVSSLRNTESGFVSCLHCSPVAKFEPDTVSAFMQKVQYRATEYAREHGTDNYGPLFESIILEIEEVKVSAQILPASEKILAAIDRGTFGGEIGLVEKADALRITKLGRDEFDAAIAHLRDYREIEIVKMQGKSDMARGGRKDILRRLKQVEPAADYDPEFDQRDVYYDRWD